MTISADFVKSIVITDDVVYYSPVSSLTLNRRAHMVTDLEKGLLKEDELDSDS